MNFSKYFIVPFLLLCLSCGNNGNTPVLKRTEADAARKAPKDPNDSTVVVTLESVKGDSARVVITETQRSCILSLAELKQNGENHGSLTNRNTFAIMADLKNKSITRYVNITEFQGLWLFSDKSGNGVRFDDNGAASNIGEVDDITLRTWRVQNGRIIFAYVLSDGSDYNEKEEEATIVSLSADQLIFLFRGHQYVCKK